ncbi:MAG TPA: SURF1 family protein [Micavibrio sp.]
MKPVRHIPKAGIVFLIACITLLCALGYWQVQRLHWKENLIKTYQAEYARNPLDNRFDQNDLQAIAQKNPAMEYGSLRGHYHHDLEILIGPRTHDGAPGYHVVTPFSLAGGNGRVLVNRGWVPLDQADPARRIENQTEGMVVLTGMARRPDKPNPFTPANDPANHTWYSVDTQDIAMAVNMPVFPDVVFYAETQDPRPQGPYPLMIETRIMPKNNHLQYALFWFTMALIFAGLPLIYCFMPRLLREEP